MFNEAHRVLLFAHPSLNLRSSFAQGSLILRHILGCASSPTFLRSSFAQGSVRVRGKNSEKKLWQTLKVCQSVWC